MPFRKSCAARTDTEREEVLLVEPKLPGVELQCRGLDIVFGALDFRAENLHGQASRSKSAGAVIFKSRNIPLGDFHCKVKTVFLLCKK